MRWPGWPRKSRKGWGRQGKETISGVTEGGNQAVFPLAQEQRVPRAGNLMACFIPDFAKTNLALIKALPSGSQSPTLAQVGEHKGPALEQPSKAFRKDLGPALVSHLSSL